MLAAERIPSPLRRRRQHEMPPLALIPRRDWLACYFDYVRGQHAGWSTRRRWAKPT